MSELRLDQAAVPRLVSVIVPCRNEVEHIVPCCQSVAAQRLPEGWSLEVWVADGLSNDGTRERLAAFCEGDARFTMIDNPGRIVSTGLNRCIERARGEFIVRLDVHTVYAEDYIAQCVATWQATGADNVGGPWRAQGQDGPQGRVQRAVAAAFQSKWVAGGALSRDLAYNGEADTVYLGAWPRSTFERFGGFDETLVRNQDDEHNLRIHRGGGRIWQSPAIRSVYFPRSSKGDVFRQYRQYGYWKPFVMKKHGQAAALRHLIPGLFVAALFLCVGLMIGGSAVALLIEPGQNFRLGALWASAAGTAGLLGLTLLYGSAVLAASWRIASEAGRELFWHLPDVIAAYHFGYGLGSLRGWFDALLRGKPDPAFGRLTR
jgi:glycosyltransferase involved in cell wall biosynthesis